MLDLTYKIWFLAPNRQLCQVCQLRPLTNSVLRVPSFVGLCHANRDWIDLGNRAVTCRNVSPVR